MARNKHGFSSKKLSKFDSIEAGATNDETRVTVKGTTFTAAKERVILVDDDAAGLKVTVTLPPAVNINTIYNIKKQGSTADVVVLGDSGDTIDGGSTATLTVQDEAITVGSDGVSDWGIL